MSTGLLWPDELPVFYFLGRSVPASTSIRRCLYPYLSTYTSVLVCYRLYYGYSCYLPTSLSAAPVSRQFDTERLLLGGFHRWCVFLFNTHRTFSFLSCHFPIFIFSLFGFFFFLFLFSFSVCSFFFLSVFLMSTCLYFSSGF